MGSKITSQTVETEKNIGDEEVSINLGKFSSVKELLDAYNSLQSEFTRRSQKLKELVREVNELKQEQNLNSFNTTSLEGNKSTNVDLKNEPLQPTANCDGESQMRSGARVALDSDLKSSEFGAVLECEKKSDSLTPRVKLLSGNGQASITPPLKPQSLADAGKIARQIFDK